MFPGPSRLAAKDGILLHTIDTSHDIRQGLVARGFRKTPTDHHTVQQYTLSFRASVQHDRDYTIKAQRQRKVFCQL